MKNLVDSLKPEERRLIADFYGGNTYKAIVRLIELEREELARDHVGQRDILEVCDLTGQTKSLKKLVQTVKHIHKDYNDNLEKTKKQN